MTSGHETERAEDQMQRRENKETQDLGGGANQSFQGANEALPFLLRLEDHAAHTAPEQTGRLQLTVSAAVSCHFVVNVPAARSFCSLGSP